MSSSLFDYYREQALLPTDGGVDTEAGLRAHEQERRRLFTDKLGLPPSVFRGARLLEFGPDTGGNSLVFASWEADCTLSEPNLAAHSPIRAYFERFGLEHRLSELLNCDVETFPTPATEAERFDVVDAEGFIYTIRPSGKWIAKLAEVVRPEGFVIVTYYASWGSFFELLMKAVHAHYRELTGKGGVAAAQAVFGTKWGTIPHRRPIESWTLDVLENPFVRLEYFIDPVALCGELDAYGFALHASWPHYESGFDVHWFKRQIPPQEELRRRQEFVERNRLSYLLGRPHFVVDLDPLLEEDLTELVAAVDSFVDGFDRARAEVCGTILEGVATLLASNRVLSTSGDREASLETVASTHRLLEVMARGSAAELAAFCNSDPAFLSSWGSPSHFAVFRRMSERS